MQQPWQASVATLTFHRDAADGRGYGLQTRLRNQTDKYSISTFANQDATNIAQARKALTKNLQLGRKLSVLTTALSFGVILACGKSILKKVKALPL